MNFFFSSFSECASLKFFERSTRLKTRKASDALYLIVVDFSKKTDNK